MRVSRVSAALSVGGLLAGPAVGLARAQGPPSLLYYSVTPCRLLDTRVPGQGPALASGTPRIVTVTGACTLPATARAIAGNVTSAGLTGAGNLNLYAGDGAPPLTSALNFGAGQTRANNGVFPLAGDGTGTLAIRATVTGGGTVNVILDVAGYFAPRVTTVFTIVMASHDYAEIVGSSSAPYINSLIDSYGLATNYVDSGHPSLLNYLYLASGAAQYPGVIDIGPTTVPYFPSASDNLGNQLQTHGIPWRSYQESMGTPCTLTASGTYTPTHDPFLYFADIQTAGSLCATTNVDYSQFAGDLAAGTYRYMWITPNLVDSGHDPVANPVGALTASDAWLATEVPKILASSVYQAGGVIFLTWDQAVGRNGDSADRVPMIIISPRIKSVGFKSGNPYSHASYLATVEDMFGLPGLAAAQTANNMLEFLTP